MKIKDFYIATFIFFTFTLLPLSASDSAVDEARKRAIDFEIPEYFPSDWEAIEAQYAVILSHARLDASALNNAAVVYNDLFRKTIPLYAQAREDEILFARDELISTQFTVSFPKYLKNADSIALAALEQYKAGDYHKARDSFAEALDEYKTLLIGAGVFMSRQEIIDNGLMVYDTGNFDYAEKAAQKAINEYDTGDREAAIASAGDARLHYNTVMSNGWKPFAAEQQTAAVSQRDLTLANIKVQDSFDEGDNRQIVFSIWIDEAEALFVNAGESFNTGNFRDAALNYKNAAALFTAAGQLLSELISD